MRPVPSDMRAPRYQPPSRSDGSGGGVFRSGPSSGVNTITRPAPSTASRGEATRATGRGTSIDSRYRSGSPSSSAPRSEQPRSSQPGNSRVNSSANSKPNSSGNPASSARQPRGTTPAITDRYAGPRDSAPGVTRRSGSDAKPDASRGTGKADASRGTAANERPGKPAANTNAVVRAPRLTGNGVGLSDGTSTKPGTGPGTGPGTAIPNGSTGPAGGSTGAPISTGVVGPATCGGAFPDNSWCSSSWGCNFWDPWCGSSWGHCGWGFGWGWGCGFGFGFSWGWPCWSWSWNWWDSCYHDCWWNYSCYPTYVSSSYWWYPGSTYCPAYLYVPGTVIVVDDASYAGSEVIVADSGRKTPETEVAGITASLAGKYVELGDFYFKAGRFSDAVGAYGKARSYAPEDASLHFVLADAVFAEGDYLYAAFLIGEGLRLDPGMAAASTDKRTFYGDAATFDAQMAALDRHLERRPDDALAHLVRGYNLRFSGKPVEAITAFRRVLELDAGNRPARTFLDALEKPAAAESVIVR